MHSVSARKLYIKKKLLSTRKPRSSELLFVHRLKFVFGTLVNLPLVGKGSKYDILWLATTIFKQIVYNLFKCTRLVICMLNY